MNLGNNLDKSFTCSPARVNPIVQIPISEPKPQKKKYAKNDSGTKSLTQKRNKNKVKSESKITEPIVK